MKHLTSPHLQAGLWIGTVGVLMMVPADRLPELGGWLPPALERWIDKIQHVFAFSVMVVLLARSLNEIGSIHRPVLMAGFLTLGLSFTLEVLQALVPWRYFDTWDLVANTVGVLIALPIASHSVRVRRSASFS